MAIEVDAPPTGPSITTELICAYEGCHLPRVAPTGGRGKPSKYCAVHKPVRKERAREGSKASSSSVDSGPSMKAVESLHQVVAMGVAGVCLFVEPRYHPTSLDVDNIFQPLERIYLRHATIPTFNPDVPDAMAAFLGVSAYLTRVYGDRFTFGSNGFFGGGSRTSRTQATNARPTPRPDEQPNGRPRNNDLYGAQPSDPASDHAATFMADLHAKTSVPGAVVAGQDSDDDI
jgi:hypothetical protein